MGSRGTRLRRRMLGSLPPRFQPRGRRPVTRRLDPATRSCCIRSAPGTRLAASPRFDLKRVPQRIRGRRFYDRPADAAPTLVRRHSGRTADRRSCDSPRGSNRLPGHRTIAFILRTLSGPRVHRRRLDHGDRRWPAIPLPRMGSPTRPRPARCLCRPGDRLGPDGRAPLRSPIRASLSRGRG
jgi:hypothetical protein